MAGMFYSLQEVAAKLKKTEKEIKQIIKEGRLREFRDGPNLLFKIDEVEALMSDSSIMASKNVSGQAEQQTDEDEISLEPETVEEPIPKSAEEPILDSESASEETTLAGEEIDVLEEVDSDQLTDDIMGETKVTPDQMSLDSSGEGFSVDDMMGETSVSADSSEASLEEIEEDVNLDTFGSGSGLLDLSLQADDTSLGGILDEIYTPEDNEEQEAAAVGESASAADISAQTEEMLLEISQGPAGSRAIVPAYVEPVPDMRSNILGIMLFLPFLAVVYTVIVVVAAGISDVTPFILKHVQGIIWYIIIGLSVVELVGGTACMFGGSSGTTVKKPKVKKEPKAKKDKKAKG